MRKTTGGLTRDDLTLNRHGRIVSKRKSLAASKANNLGDWLRAKDQKFSDVPAKARKGTNGTPKFLLVPSDVCRGPSPSLRKLRFLRGANNQRQPLANLVSASPHTMYGLYQPRGSLNSDGPRQLFAKPQV